MCVPVCSARSVVWTSIALTAGSSEPSQVNSPISRCSAPSTVPSAAKKRTSAALTGATGSRVWARTPGA